MLYRERTNNERDMYVIRVGKDGHPARTRISSTLWKIDGCPMTYYMISAANECTCQDPFTSRVLSMDDTADAGASHHYQWAPSQ